MRILLVVIDHLSHLSYFPLGIAYIAAAAREKGHEVEIWNQETYHYPDSEIQTYLDENELYDVVGVSIYGYQMFKKSIEVCKYIQKSKNKPIVVLGSNGPSACPEYFLEQTKADYIIKGEGEASWVGLLRKLENNESIDDCAGLSWMDNGKLKENPVSPLIRPVDSLPFPAWDLFPMDAYTMWQHEAANHSDRCMVVLYSRGCPQNCNFCFRLYDSYRLRSFDSLFEELRILKKDYRIDFIEFADENIMINEKAAMRFGEEMLKENTVEKGLGIRWACHGVTPSCTKPALKLMKAAGMRAVNLGIESLDQTVIDNITKQQTVQDAYNAVENCKEVGIHAGLNIIWGNIGDTEESLRLGTDFLIKYNQTHHLRTIKPVTPFPGTPLYHYAIKEGLLSGPADFYEKYQNSDRMTCNFTELEDKKFYQLLYKANKKIVESWHKNVARAATDSYKDAYFNYDPEIGFRGPRHI